MAAPITSYGYAGTIAPNAVWGKLQWALGARYWVADSYSLTVTPVAGVGRQVSISAGYFGGSGVLDELTSAYVFTFPTATTETWFLLVAKRKWGATQATDFAAVNAGNGAALPSRTVGIGVEDDQPVALVQVRQDGSIGTIRDLRVMGGKDYFIARDELVLSYMTFLGYSIRITDKVWTRCLDFTGAETWRAEPSPWEKTDGLLTETGSSILVSQAGWSGSALDIRGTRDGNVIELDVELARTGATLAVGAHGELADTWVCTIQSKWRPTSRVVVPVYYVGGDQSTDRGTFMGLGSVDTNGYFYLHAGSPAMDIVQRKSGERSIAFTATFIQR